MNTSYCRLIKYRARFFFNADPAKAILATALAALGAMSPLFAAARPNVLFIMSDDHTTQAIGAYGSRLASLNPTPNIDKLAEEGIRFDRVFCVNSICSPSRANILTGQYSHTNGVVALSQPLEAEKQYLAIEMKKAGYTTAVIGKWHLIAEPGAFDYYAVMQRQGDYFDPTFRVSTEGEFPNNEITRKGQHSSDAITDLSLNWLENIRDKSKPFMLLHHFKAPHDNFKNAPRYNDYLADVEVPMPDNLYNLPNGSEGSRGMGESILQPPSWWGMDSEINQESDESEREKLAYQVVLKHFLRCVKGVDDNVQRLIDYLRESGELENTIIIYTADQGYFLGEHSLWDKRWMYEESLRMPFIVHWPKGHQRGVVNDWMINNTYFAPTILDFVGAEVPDYMEGHSFAAALKGEPKPGDWQDTTYYHYWMQGGVSVPAHFGIRDERYKLIFFYGQNSERAGNRIRDTSPAAWEFYDLERDPKEMNNLYSNPEYSQIITEMKQRLKTMREELGDVDTEPQIVDVIRKHWDD